MRAAGKGRFRQLPSQCRVQELGGKELELTFRSDPLDSNVGGRWRVRIETHLLLESCVSSRSVWEFPFAVGRLRWEVRFMEEWTSGPHKDTTEFCSTGRVHLILSSLCK